MSIALSLSATNPSGATVSGDHFGVNVTFYYQGLGDLHPWDKVDEITETLGLSTLRYPGGAETEAYFDITNPDAAFVADPNGNTTVNGVTGFNLIPQFDFLAYCQSSGIRPSIVVPMLAGLDGNPVNGHENVDPGWISDLKAYVTKTLTDAGGTVAVFELGNEYQSHMTSLEYGRVASAAADAIQEAIDGYAAANGLGAGWQEPQIAVQVWNQSVGGGLTTADLVLRNQTVLAEFDTDELAAVDAIVGHWYFGVAGDNNPTVDEIAGLIAPTWALADAWDTATGRDLDRIVSEWNVQHDYTSYGGLRQVAPMLEMVSAFLAGGADRLDLWAMEYNWMAIAAPGADLTVAGEFFGLMKDTLSGTRVAEIAETAAGVAVHAFVGSDTAYLFVSSLQSGVQDIALDFGGMTSTVRASTLIGAAGGDGVYRGTGGLAVYEEPDADLTQTAGAFTFGSDMTLGAYEVMMIELDLGIDGTGAGDTLTGTIFGDTIRGHAGNDLVFGGAGDDTVDLGDGNDYVLAGSGRNVLTGGAGIDVLSYYHSTAGVDVDLLSNAVSGGWAAEDTISGFERVYGSNGFGDTLRGSDGNNLIRGYGGNDLVYDRAGNDRIELGDGNDYVLAGGGADTFVGGAGSDTFAFVGNFGADTIVDFDAADVIDMSGVTTVSDWADLVNNHLQQVGQDAVITALGGNTITLLGVSVAGLGSGDFLF